MVINQPASKLNHFQALDFLRGVAAIIVVMFHFSSRIDLAGLFNYGYLAVDFFFVLSGFVIDRAYAERLASGALRFKAFFLIRIVRLLPLVVFGTLIAATIDLFRHGNFSITQHVTDIVMTGILNCLCLPTFWKTTLEQTTFPLNGPVWSLSFELIANFSCVPIIKFTNSNSILAAMALLSIIILIWATVNVASTGRTDVNFGTHFQTFLLGFPRVFWSYSVGILISRAHIYIPPMSKWFYAVILIAILSCPQLPPYINAVYFLIVICLVNPLIVLSAAQSKHSQQYSIVSKWSGDMLYPLYVIHYPLVRVVATITRMFNLAAGFNFLVATMAALCFMILASFVFQLIDVPIRHRLTQKIYPRRTPSLGSTV